VARITVRLIDGTATYTLAPQNVQAACQRRFETPDGIAAVHPEKPGWFLFDVRNWWDGPSEIKDNGDGTLTFTNPWTNESDTFSII
jgi:hypothetical protein